VDNRLTSEKDNRVRQGGYVPTGHTLLCCLISPIVQFILLSCLFLLVFVRLLVVARFERLCPSLTRMH